MTLVKAVTHNKRFKIVKQQHGSKHSTYMVITLKRNGKPAKRQRFTEEFNNKPDARYAIRKWDFA